MKKFNVAVVGATGVVGETMRDVLEKRDFPIENFYPVASSRSAGDKIQFQGKTVVVQDLAEFDFSQVDIALFSAGGDISREYAPKAGAAGAVVIDNSSAFRGQSDIPLVVSEVNPDALADYANHNIIANPNCSTMQLMVALKPIFDAVGIAEVEIATYQAVSGTGKPAVEELAKQTTDILNVRPVEAKVYPKQIAFNVIPHGGAFLDNGYTEEEMKLVHETHKILGDDSIRVNPTVARVPVFFGHSEAVHLKTHKPIEVSTAKKLLSEMDGLILVDDPSALDYPTAVTHAADHDGVFVGRVRQLDGEDKSLSMWVVADNVRKGAATNAVQIAEILIQKYL